jgi:hypothetical protein
MMHNSDIESDPIDVVLNAYDLEKERLRKEVKRLRTAMSFISKHRDMPDNLRQALIDERYPNTKS